MQAAEELRGGDRCLWHKDWSVCVNSHTTSKSEWHTHNAGHMSVQRRAKTRHEGNHGPGGLKAPLITKATASRPPEPMFRYIVFFCIKIFQNLLSFQGTYYDCSQISETELFCWGPKWQNMKWEHWKGSKGSLGSPFLCLPSNHDMPDTVNRNS